MTCGKCTAWVRSHGNQIKDFQSVITLHMCHITWVHVWQRLQPIVKLSLQVDNESTIALLLTNKCRDCEIALL